MSGGDLQPVLAAAWHRESAAASLERWQQVCAGEGWGAIPRDVGALVRVFGASWYFTRFIFFRGPAAARLIDEAAAGSPAADRWLEAFDVAAAGDVEEQVEALRVLKNEAMLRLLIGWLDGRSSQRQTEAALTQLAETVLRRVLDLFVFGETGENLHAAVLGMGRLAGGEMNFGSDLDLIFLHDTPAGAQGGGDLSRRVRGLLRHIAAVSPAGSLYDVDMRLRPHGTSGALITTADSFKAYHAGQREVWERQMMTRCRPVCDPERVGARAMQSVLPHVYGRRPAAELRTGIRAMRIRVERELGRPQGKIELKRGRGGLMDIDFISHYLQLRDGVEDPELRTGSTREVLERAAATGKLAPEAAARLLDAYDWLKRVENCLRLFDMRSISAFSDQPDAIGPLARAMGLGDDAQGFLDEYRHRATSVRACFDDLLGD